MKKKLIELLQSPEKNTILFSKIHDEVKIADERLWDIVMLRFQMKKSYAGIGRLFGISRERVRQIIAKFLENILKEFKNQL